MIIDGLTHATPDGRWFHTDFDASEGRLLREMDSQRVDRAVLVPMTGFIEDEFVYQVSARHPDRLIPAGSINPALYAGPDEAAAAARERLAASPAKAVKLHPRLHRYDLLDPRCLAVLEELSSWPRGPAIWLDSLLHYRGGIMSKSLVDAIHQVVGGFANLDFVILHAGGTWAPQLAQAVSDCPNALIDLSFTLKRHWGTPLVEELRLLLRRFDRRVVFGSDFPEIAIDEAIGLSNQICDGLSVEKRANIMGRNLQTLLAR